MAASACPEMGLQPQVPRRAGLGFLRETAQAAWQIACYVSPSSLVASGIPLGVEEKMFL